MEIIRELFVLLGVEADKADFERAEKRIESVKRLLTAATVAAGGLAAGLFAATREFARETEEIDAWSARIGASVETLSALKVAFESVGLEGEDGFEAITDAAERASDVLLNVKNLTGDAGESFKALGFRSVRELAGANGGLRNSLELFRDLVARLRGVENQGERTGIAMRLFGDDVGRRIVPFIERYGDRLDEVIQTQARFGAIVTDADVETVRQYRGAFAGFSATVRGLAFVVGRNLLPPLSRVLNRVSDWAATNRVLIRQRIASLVQGIGRAVEFAFVKTRAYVRSINSVVEALGGWRVVLGVLGVALAAFTLGQVGSLIGALGRLVGVVRGLSLASTLLAAKAVALGAAFAAFVLIMDDVITTLQGGDSVISRFVARFDPANAQPDEWWVITAIRTAVGMVQELGKAASAVFDLFDNNEAIRDNAQAALARGISRTALGGLGAPGDLLAQGADAVGRFFRDVEVATDTASLNPEDLAILRLLAGGSPGPVPSGTQVGPVQFPSQVQQVNNTTIEVQGNADTQVVDEIARRIDQSNADNARRIQGAVEQ